MRTEYDPGHKFTSPMARYAYECALDSSWLDDEAGDVQFGGWFGRIGRRIVTEDSQGFVTVEKYATVRDAEEAMEDIAASLAPDDGDDYEAPMCEHEGCGRLAALPLATCDTHRAGGLWDELRQAERILGTE